MKNFILTTSIMLLLINFNSNSQWFVQYSPWINGDVTSLAVIDTNTAYVTMLYDVEKTTNGGTSWFNSLHDATFFDDIQFLNPSTGFVIGRNPNYSVIYITTNAGLNWVTAGSLPVLSIYHISFIDASTGYAAAFGGIYKTTNGGQNWASSYPHLSNFTAISFVDINSGWAVNDLGYVFRTTNGGNLWTGTAINPGNALHGLFFLNNNTGWIASDNSSIYKSTNSGWIPFTLSQVSISSCQLNSVYFYNDMTGWAGGCQGSIHKSTDGGMTWSMQTIGQATTIFKIQFANSLTGWAAGTSGKVLRTTNGGLVPVLPISSEVPEKFSLSQNYPNPFNPVTKIKFSVADLSNVKIAVYNTVGDEIAVPVNEQLQPGVYETDWDGTNFSTGIYYFRMTVSGDKANGFTETRKMVLLK